DCPTEYSVTKCTPCQVTLYQLANYSIPGDHASTLTCDHYNRFVDFVIADNVTTPIKTNGDYMAAVRKFCNLNNPCPQNVSINGYQQIQISCAKEITSDAYLKEEFEIYYYAVPHYQNLCLPSTKSGFYAWFNIHLDELDYIENKYGPAYPKIFYNLFPPSTNITFVFENKTSDRKKTDIPKDILCSSDYLELALLYGEYVAAHKLTGGFKFITDPIVDLLSNVTARCDDDTQTTQSNQPTKTETGVAVTVSISYISGDGAYYLAKKESIHRDYVERTRPTENGVICVMYIPISSTKKSTADIEWTLLHDYHYHVLNFSWFFPEKSTHLYEKEAMSTLLNVKNLIIQKLQSYSLSSLALLLYHNHRLFPKSSLSSIATSSAPIAISKNQSSLQNPLIKNPLVSKNNQTTSRVPAVSLPSISENVDKSMDGITTLLMEGVKTVLKKYPHCVVLTQVGIFWEIYFQQALKLAPLLDIKIGRRKVKKGRVPIVGFPVHALDKYLQILLDEGHLVVLCAETPNKNAECGDLKYVRNVTRIITPGTLISESFLDHNKNNFLLAIALDESLQDTGLSWIDVSTGEFFMQKSVLAALSSDIARIRPSEVLLSDVYSLYPEHQIWSHIDRVEYSISFELRSTFDAKATSWEADLKSEGIELREVFSPIEMKASAGLFKYIEKNLVGRKIRVEHPIRVNPEDTMIIDATALSSLEITASMRDNCRKGSLLHAIQRTKTASGSRVLNRWLRLPSTSLDVITIRQDLVEYFYNNTHLTSDIRVFLEDCSDAQRTTQRLSLDYGGIEDYIKLKRTIKSINEIEKRIREELPTTPNNSVENFIDRLQSQDDLMNTIDSALNEEALIKMQEANIELNVQSNPNVINDDKNKESPRYGRRKTNQNKSFPQAPSPPQDSFFDDKSTDNWYIKKDYSAALKRLHLKLDNWYLEKNLLIEQLKKELDVKKIILSHTPHGFVATINRKEEDRFQKASSLLPFSLTELKPTFVKRDQRHAIYFIPQWNQLGGKIENHKIEIRKFENKIFADLRSKVIQNWNLTVQNSCIIDELDVTSSLAILAKEMNFVRPAINNGTTLKIIGGRHPIVETSLKEKNIFYSKNDCHIGGDDKERVWLITGPNMGGKSTFLRQNAVISVLAQIGSFVPADYAEIGIVDQIFSRVGASDSLFQNQSTFMVEMIETAHVIMDEVGRGTTTLDGIAISFASLYHLHYHNRCRTLFATHFHELSEMIRDFENAACYCTGVDGSFHYIHQLKEGVNKNSCALKVAQLAGMPSSVLKVAEHTRKYLGQLYKPASIKMNFLKEREINNKNDKIDGDKKHPEEESTFKPWLKFVYEKILVSVFSFYELDHGPTPLQKTSPDQVSSDYSIPKFKAKL
ncbi:6450_t:CDS:10, partial [Ambispora gerdemannii]